MRRSFLGFVPGADLPGLYRLADVDAIMSEAELRSLTTPLPADGLAGYPDLVVPEER